MLMTMKEFHKRLVKSEVYGARGFFKGFAITVIGKGGKNGDPYYDIFRSGKISIHHSRCDIENRSEMLEGDFEPFSDIQIIKSGYLEFPQAKCIDDVQSILTDLYAVIECDKERNICGASLFDYSPECGKTVLKTGFDYISPNSLEIHIQPRDELWNEKRLYEKDGLKLHNYGSKFKVKGWFMSLRIIDIFNAGPDDRRSVENQLEEINFILRNLPDGVVFHDNYIRQWEPIYFV